MEIPHAVTEGSMLFLELGALLLALAVLGRLGVQLGISTVPLYLVGGLVAGALDPFALSTEFIEVGAQIGIVLLLFMLGLEYSAEELTASVRSHAPAGLLDAALNFSPGFAAGLLLGWDPEVALLLGGATYISSSGVIAKVVEDLGRLRAPETPVVIALLVMEDLAMVLFLPVATVLIAGGALGQAVGTIAVAVVAAALVLTLALRHAALLNRVIASPSDEILLLTLSGVVLTVGGLAEQLQISAGVAAFLIGIAVSGSVAERARWQMAPVRDLFAATFFVFFGLQIDTGELLPASLAAAALALVTGATKLATGWWAARRAGIDAPGTARAGTTMIIRGEFSIVIAGLGVAAGAEAALGPLVGAYVLMTTILGALLAHRADLLASARKAHPSGDADR